MAFANKGSAPKKKKGRVQATTTNPVTKSAAGKVAGKSGKIKAVREKDVSSKWTTEQVAAGTKLQAHIRGYLCRKQYRHKLARKKASDREMEILKQAAWTVQLQYDRKQREKARQAAQQEAKRQKHIANVKKQLLESAFDDELEAIIRLSDAENENIYDILEISDASGNSLASEAAAGGAQSTLEYLLGAGADPNTRGEYARTPLWRAAFLGKTDCVGPLLEAGADPRIGNEAGELPVHVASNEAIKSLIMEWDTNETDALKAAREASQERRKAERVEQAAKALKSAEDTFEAKQEASEAASQHLKKTRQNMEKAIYEYDICVAESKPQDMIQVALQHVQTLEKEVEEAKKRSQKALEEFDLAKIALREHRQDPDEEQLPGETLLLKDMNDVIIRDIGGKLKSASRWPLVIDVSGQSSVFFRYADTNYVNALSPKDTAPESLRKSILGALRYGKPLVMDLMDVDLWSELPQFINAVHDDLYVQLMDGAIAQDKQYLKLVRSEDGEAYGEHQFQDDLLNRFQCIFLTSAKDVNDKMLETTYAFRIKVTA